MTNIPIDMTFGPISRGRLGASGSTAGYNLDDADDANGMTFQIPKDGLITDLGFLVTNVVGSPSPYYAGLMQLTGDGVPSTVSGYNGAETVVFGPPSSGFYWVPLSIPVSAYQGDFAAIAIFPTSSGTYNTSNYIAITSTTLLTSHGPVRRHAYTTSWSTSVGMGYWAIRYNDDSVWGFPIRQYAAHTYSGASSPNEVGMKFTLPVDVISPGVGMDYTHSTLTDPEIQYTITLYDDADNVLRQKVVTNYREIFPTQNASIAEFYWDTPVEMGADVVYRLAIKPSGYDRSIGMYSYRFESENSRINNIFYDVNRLQKTYRTDEGAWTDLNDEIVWAGIRVSNLVITASGGQPTASGGGGAYAYVG